MNLDFDRTVTNDLDLAMKREWIEPNGIGGWASSTLIGLNTRRYHGLLVAALHPPGRRMVLVSKVDESILVNARRYELGCNAYPGVIHPNGDQFLESFSLDLMPTAVYEAGGVKLARKVFCVHGENTTVILYDVLHAPGPFTLEFQPIIAGRDYHQLMIQNDQIRPEADVAAEVVTVQPYDATPPIHIHLAGASFEHRPDWYYQFEYAEEQLRGLECQEDLFSYGVLRLEAGPGDGFGIILSTENPAGRNPFALYEAELKRRKALLKPFAKASPELRRLALASDAFVVKRGPHLSVLAGYPWFTDRGRDTAASVPGLCLGARRIREARRILHGLAEGLQEGLMPGLYLETGDDSVDDVSDASLWFAPAVHAYHAVAGDESFCLEVLYPALLAIHEAMHSGARHGFRIESDHLLHAGTTLEQVSWMNIRVDDVPVTPRHGKTVEQNALWHNLLQVAAGLADTAGDASRANSLRREAAAHARAFVRAFWNESAQSLNDVIRDNGVADASIRPSQVLALGLPHPLLDGPRAGAVLKTLREHLWTPAGLRSLSPKDPRYQPSMEPDLLSQDAVLHQGPARFQFLHAYWTALSRFGEPDDTRRMVAVVREFLRGHLPNYGLGHVCEVCDAAPPHACHGAIAFAWNTAELLHVLAEAEGFALGNP